MTDQEHQPDPEIVAAVEHLRDRFGLTGLRDAARLLDAEIVRVAAETEAAFAENG